MSLLELKPKMEILTAEQDLLLDKDLADMDRSNLNDQLKALTDGKQRIRKQIGQLQQTEAQQTS